MFKIEDFKSIRESVGASRVFVHSFYKVMFMKLYGLEEEEAEVYLGKDGAVADNCDFLYPLVREIWECHKRDVSRFYDIRINEETGQAAPEYAILNKAGIREISPMSIKGMGSMALLLGLQMVESDVGQGECAIMLLAEINHDFKAQGENIACAFAIYPSDTVKSQEGIRILNYCIHLTKEEMREKVRGFEGTAVFSEIELEDVSASCHNIYRCEHGLTDPLLYLYKCLRGKECADVLSIHGSGNIYGLVYYQVLGKEEVRSKTSKY